MGDIEESRNENNTSFVWVIRNFVDIQKHYQILLVKAKIEVKGSGDEWLIELWWKYGTNLYFKIKHIRFDFAKHENGEIVIEVLTSNLSKAHKYYKKIDVNYESEIDIRFTSLSSNNATLLLFGKHLVLHGTICSASSVSPASSSRVNHSLVYKNQVKLLETGNYHDFTIKVKSREFLCHKAILDCRSAYFCDLFKENGSLNILEIDSEPKVYKKLLEYIYTGEVKVTEDVVLQLLDAASKFSLKELKDICGNCLLSYFSFQNMFELHEISCTHELDSVRERALCLIATFANDSQISCTDDTQDIGIDISEANVDDAKIDVSRPTASDEIKATNQPPGETETAMAPFGKKPYLPSADLWYTLEYRTIFSHKWKFSISAKNGISHQYFCDEESGCRFEMKYQIEKTDRLFTGVYKKEFVLHLLLLSSIESSVNIKYSFCFLNQFDREVNDIYDGSCRFSKNDTAGPSRVVLRIDVDSIPEFQLSKKKVASLKCIVLLENSFFHNPKLPCSDRSNLIRDVSSLHTDKLFCDLTIRCTGNEFPCHKAIVLNRCPFFKQQMIENIVVLEDIEPQSFRNFVSFLYGNTYMYESSGKIVAWELVKYAKMFLMNGLLEMCVDELVSQLNTENALKVYDLSKTYNIAKLEEASLRFISKFFSKIFSKEQNRNHEVFKDTHFLRKVLKPLGN